MVPSVKETSYPVEEVFQMHTDDVINSDYSLIDTKLLDLYSRQEFYDEHLQDTVYGTKEEFNTLFYDLNNDSDSEASEIHHTDSDTNNLVSQCQSFASISKSDTKISTFVCT